MMPQQFQRPEPPNKVNAFMEKAGWPIITLTIGTVLAAIIIAVWIGKIQVLNFDWLMLLLALVLLAITFFSWCITSVKSRYVVPPFWVKVSGSRTG